MGTRNKENVQLVISHIEGCSGNFLGYLAADVGYTVSDLFRIDRCENSKVLSINGRGDLLTTEVNQRLHNHSIIVTHNFDVKQLHVMFPNAKLIQIYPYTRIGNVLYNICYKKLKIKLDNVIDNYLIDINFWFDRIKSEKPQYQCTDYWDITDSNKVSQLIETPLTTSQQLFFDNYWKTQLSVELEYPTTPMGISELVNYWKIDHVFSPWLVAWTIFVYELINNLSDNNRLWSIDNLEQFTSWEMLSKIEMQYK